MGKLTAEDKLKQSIERQRFTLYRLNPKWLGQTYTDGGRTFKIIGLSSTGKRVRLENEGNTNWTAPVGYVKVKMADDPAAMKKEMQNAEEKEYREEYKHWAKLLGLPTDGIGKQFMHRGHVCTILGLRYKRKANVMVERNGNRGWQYPVEAVLNLLKSNPA